MGFFLGAALSGLLIDVGNYWHAGKPNVLDFALSTFSFNLVLVVIGIMATSSLLLFLINKLVEAFNAWLDKKILEVINKKSGK